jgi:hypothetical protein
MTNERISPERARGYEREYKRRRRPHRVSFFKVRTSFG